MALPSGGAILRGESCSQYHEIKMQKQGDSISHASTDGILTVRVAGRVAIDTLAGYALMHQDVWALHPCILWDLIELDPRDITSDAVLRMPELFARIHQLRAGGRTALLIQKDAEFLAKIIIAQAETTNAPVEQCAFCSKENALAWLRAI